MKNLELARKVALESIRDNGKNVFVVELGASKSNRTGYFDIYILDKDYYPFRYSHAHSNYNKKRECITSKSCGKNKVYDVMRQFLYDITGATYGEKTAEQEDFFDNVMKNFRKIIQ